MDKKIEKYIKKYKNMEKLKENKQGSGKIISIIICIIIICSIVVFIYFALTLNNTGTGVESEQGSIITIVRPPASPYPLVNTISILANNPKDLNFPLKSVPIRLIYIYETNKPVGTVKHIREYDVKVGQKYYENGILYMAITPFIIIIIEPTDISSMTVYSTKEENADLSLFSLNIRCGDKNNVMALSNNDVMGYTFGFAK